MSQKYRQRGYQDEEPKKSASSRSTSAPKQPDGPRGRGLGAPTESVFRCADCGARQKSSEVALDTLCDACGETVHNCLNCRHFDSSARFECRQELRDRLSSKRKANSCELFASKLTAERPKDSIPREPDNPKSAFDALFKGI